MKRNNNLPKFLKEFLVFVAILVVLYIIFKIFKDVKIALGIIILGFGVMSIIWTLIAKYNLSPKSNLHLFTNNFLACSIAVISLTVIRLLSSYVLIPWLIYVELFFIFTTFFFFVLASYYIYTIGYTFGFEHDSRNIKKFLEKKK